MALGVLALVTGAAGASATEPLFVEEITMVGPASYATAGDTGLQAAYRALGVAQSGRTIVAVLPVDTFGYGIGYTSSTGKLKLYQGDNTNAAAAPGVEVASTTNLSAVTFKLLIISR